ncbi:MAG: hypothetical protein JXB13_09430 [Phycisphaerae bacterium]|nr:hypothetical protein [Phycisphaerae bacterium]
MFTRTRCMTGLAAVLLTLGRADAAPKSAGLKLLEQTSDRTLVAVAWSGWDETGKDFDGTAVGKILAEESVRSFVSSIVKAIEDAILKEEANDPDVTLVFDTIRNVWPILTQSPGAFVVTAGDPKSEMVVSFGLVVEAGRRREAVDAVFERLAPHLEGAKENSVAGVTLKTLPDATLSWGWVKDRFVIGVGDLTPLVAALSDGKGTLGASAAFRRRMAAVPGERDLLLSYADATAIGRLVEAVAGPEEAETIGHIKAVLQALGLSTAEAIVGRMHAQGTDLVVDSVVLAPAPRRGLWTCVEGTVGPEAMKRVPSDAIFAAAGTFRPDKLPGVAVDAVRAVSPEKAEEMVKEGYDGFEAEIGVPIRAEILANLAGEYTLYTRPIPNPLIPQQFVLLLRIKNAETVSSALGRLDKWIQRQMQANMASEQVKTFGETSVTVHAWNLAAVVQLPLQLAWAVVGDQLVFELSAGEPGGSLEHVVKGGSSLADDPEFAKAASQFPRQMSHFSFTRDRDRMADSLAQLSMVWGMLQMGVSQQGIVLPPLPPVTDITQHLGYTSSCSWFDETGWHSRSSGSLAVADPVLIAGAAAGGVSILLPSLSRARELSKRTVSGANVRGVVTCCKIYANENDDKFPPNMQVLIDTGEMTPRQLVNPRVRNADAKDHYIYIPGHTEASPPDLVVIYENPAYVDEGINIGYVDGHVEFVRGEAALERVRDTYKRMGLEVPELKYITTRGKSLLERFLPPTDAGKK